MPNVEALIEQIETQPDTAALLELVDRFLDETTTAAERQAIRAAVDREDLKQAYETLYFEGTGMEQPEIFLRRMLAVLFMTRGLSDPDTARQIVSELRVFATHHGLNFEAFRDSVRALPGARPQRPRRRPFLIGNAALFAALALGTAAVQTAPETLRLILQISVLLGVIGAQMALLYWYFRT